MWLSLAHFAIARADRVQTASSLTLSSVANLGAFPRLRRVHRREALEERVTSVLCLIGQGLLAVYRNLGTARTGFSGDQTNRRCNSIGSTCLKAILVPYALGMRRLSRLRGEETDSC